MSTPVNYFKLGLFVTVATLIALITAAALGARAATPETVTYHTYFNESVQGLDAGAPVKFRGVNIGVVDRIDIASDKRHVDVSMKFEVKRLESMGLSRTGTNDEGVQLALMNDLRTQLGSQGITGVKFILIDFFDPESNPPIELPFEPAKRYIPAAASLMKNLEDSVVKAVDRFPEIADKLSSVIARVDNILGTLEKEKVPENIAATVENLNGTIGQVRALVKNTDKAALPDKAAKALANLDDGITKLNGVMGRLDGDKGFVSRANRAVDAFGDVGKSATGTARQLEDTMRDLSEASKAIRDLADALEREPDMLLKGRAKKE